MSTYDTSFVSPASQLAGRHPCSETHRLWGKEQRPWASQQRTPRR